MWKPWALASRSNEGAIANARSAATELSRRRVERLEVELYVMGRNARQSGRVDRPA